MDNQKARVRMAAFAASDGDLYADKHSFEARAGVSCRSRTVRFTSGVACANVLGANERVTKAAAAKNIARQMRGKLITVLLIRRMDIRYDQNPINSRCDCRYCEPRIGFLKLPRRPAQAQQTRISSAINS